MQFFQHQRCNEVLPPHPNDADKVVPLPIQRTNMDGQPLVISFWKPDADDLAKLLAGGCVALVVLGRSHPPLMLEVLRD